MPAVASRFEQRLLTAFIAGATLVLVLAGLTWSFSVKAVDTTAAGDTFIMPALLRRKVSGPADLRFRGPFPDRLVVKLEKPS